MSAFSFSFLRYAVPMALMLVLAFSVNAQTLYRYVDADGRVVYTDKPPPPSAKDAQVKSMDANIVETDKVPMSTRQAMERFPVTLYAFSCGTLCEDAEALLQKRGIPYTFVNTQNQDGADKLKKLTGDTQVPVLQVGVDFVKGFNESAWQQKLDQGGYSKDAGVKTATKHTEAKPEPKAEPAKNEPPKADNDAAPAPVAPSDAAPTPPADNSGT